MSDLRKTPSPRNPQLEKMEKELVKKLPSEVSSAEERGERITTGKVIAGGGKSEPPKK